MKYGNDEMFLLRVLALYSFKTRRPVYDKPVLNIVMLSNFFKYICDGDVIIMLSLSNISIPVIF